MSRRPTANLTESDPPATADLDTIKSLLPYLWPKGQFEMRARVVVAIACLVLAKAASVYVPILYKEAVDLISGDKFDFTVLLWIVVAYGMTRLGQQAFAQLREFFFARVAQRAIRAVAIKTFRHLHRLSLRFHLDRQTGGLTRVIERGTKAIEFLLNFMLFNILPTLFEIFLVCGVLWWMFDFRYAIATFGTIFSYITFTMLVTEWRLKIRRRMNTMDNRANTRAVDSLLNYETVKYFGNETHEEERYDRSMRSYEDAAVKSRTSLSLVNVGQGGIIAVGLMVVMALAGGDIAAGKATVGDFVMVNTYLIQLYMPLNFLGFVYREIKQSLTDMQQMFLLLDEEQEIEDAADATDLTVEKGAVRFENVKFGYSAERGILKGISFDVPAGKTVALVGPSGAGKSTISRLLFRFYDIDDGAILIDGQDIRSVTQESLRRAIGIVPQDTVLFNDTIYYNIAYGRPDASTAEIEEAARLARIHDFVVSLPDGYESTVGERGLKLSGGEKQRVAIARTLLKQPKIFLFDEATSALDSQTEKAIQNSLSEVSQDYTTLVIAHRLSTVVDAHEIIVLRDGEIAERGNHDSLLSQGGIYAAMWRQQMREESVTEPVEELDVAEVGA
ncbi:ABCB family ABC transporter ATP-binding protein/permease [Nisaea nitritireducens]|uniref:ABCB family ABC transporter ATP-binding protein/permease n=1 Tax=Nisaea nitritireducens TaxID=568392 RepID=UPI0018695384|nr:ABC transporter ATP-binding protein/permease [Nisaea nitritireducens]